MNSIFAFDSPLMQFLSRVADLMLLNLLIIIFSLPLVTAGAAMAAAQEYVRKLRANEACGIRVFWRLFKGNFRQATVVYLLYAVFAAACILGIGMVTGAEQNPVHPMALVLLFLALLGLGVLHWAMLLIAYFQNKLGHILVNSALCTLIFFPRTLLILVLAVLPVSIFFSLRSMVIAFPIYLIIGFGLTAYLIGIIGAKSMAKLMKGVQKPEGPPEEPAEE